MGEVGNLPLFISFDGDAKKWLDMMGLWEGGSSGRFFYIPYRIFSTIEYLYYPGIPHLTFVI